MPAAAHPDHLKPSPIMLRIITGDRTWPAVQCGPAVTRDNPAPRNGNQGSYRVGVTPRIPVKALALIRRPSDGALLVGEAADPATGLVFHRSLGGHVEFGELASETVVRELMEELGVQVRVGELLGVLENRFEFDGMPGHEIAFVLAAEFVDPTAYELDRFEFLDAADAATTLPVVTWRPPTATTPPLFPSGVEQLLGRQ
jgi:ADP-ribose pyrophosphatase YjhB (NUDIX family)